MHSATLRVLPSATVLPSTGCSLCQFKVYVSDRLNCPTNEDHAPVFGWLMHTPLDQVVQRIGPSLSVCFPRAGVLDMTKQTDLGELCQSWRVPSHATCR
jgi:hypothetical protein